MKPRTLPRIDPRRAIPAALASAPEGLTAEELSEKTGLTIQQVGLALGDLRMDRQVVDSGTTRRAGLLPASTVWTTPLMLSMKFLLTPASV